MIRRNLSECQNGFTLIEVLVVVMIIGLLAGMVIPYAMDSASASAMAGARMLTADLQYAQNEAITTQQPVTVTFTTATETYAVSNASGPLIHPMNRSNFVVDFRTERGFEGLDVVSASFGGSNSVTFDELGSPDNAGTIVLQAGSQTYSVAVGAATGRVVVSGG